MEVPCSNLGRDTDFIFDITCGFLQSLKEHSEYLLKLRYFRLFDFLSIFLFGLIE
jgi:hypothetical protein